MLRDGANLCIVVSLSDFDETIKRRFQNVFHVLFELADVFAVPRKSVLRRTPVVVGCFKFIIRTVSHTDSICVRLRGRGAPRLERYSIVVRLEIKGTRGSLSLALRRKNDDTNTFDENPFWSSSWRNIFLPLCVFPFNRFACLCYNSYAWQVTDVEQVT